MQTTMTNWWGFTGDWDESIGSQTGLYYGPFVQPGGLASWLYKGLEAAADEAEPILANPYFNSSSEGSAPSVTVSP
jgi:hypothetical protein